MGLDQYLHLRRIVSAREYVDRTVVDNPLYPVVVEAVFPDVTTVVRDADDFAASSVTVSLTVARWRKSNQLHAWFVEHVQGGSDKSGEYYVSRETLQTLLDVVSDSLDRRDPAALMPMPGFFAGSTDITGSYWQDLEYTRKALRAALSYDPSVWTEITYTSSW